MELKEAKLDLVSAQEEIKKKSWKWSVEKAYYAMFHASRSLLLLKGYKERRHRCLLIGLKELFVKTAQISQEYFDFIETAKFRRKTLFILHDIMKK
ncbi:MAG: HEPN domain-containing protein [Candidatus Aenigmatarchaeota archaeon]